MNNMIDLHNHILYGIDDGSRSIDESINIIKSLLSIGFTDIIITPHYIDGTSYNCNNFGKKIILNLIKERLAEENINVNLYLGNEVFILDNPKHFIDEEEILTLNNSKYLLMEVPFEQEVMNLDDYLFRLISKGIVPVIAHPERYRFLQENPDKIKKYLNMGVLFQGNFASITGRYGKHAMKTLKYFLKNHYLNFLGTDVHHETSSFYQDFPKMKKAICKIIGEKEFIKITSENPKIFFNN